MSREAKNKKKGIAALEDSRTCTSDPLNSGNSTSRKRRGLLSRKRLTLRHDEHSVESTVAADESVSSGLSSGVCHLKQQSPHRPRNVSSSSTCAAFLVPVLPRRQQSQPSQAQFYPYRRRTNKDVRGGRLSHAGDDNTSQSSNRMDKSSLSSHSQRSTMSCPVDVDDPQFAPSCTKSTNDRASLSMLLGSMKIEPSSRKLAECGPVDLDAMLSEDEEDDEEIASENYREREGPVCVDESGPVDVDDYLPASGSVDSLPMVDDSGHSSSYEDFSGREYFAGKDLWEEEDDEFERGLCGYEEGFEPVITTDASELFPPHEEPPRFAYRDQWTSRGAQPRAKPRDDQHSKASQSTLAEC